MRIILVVHHFPKVSETFIVDKFLGLLARGHDVHVVAEHEHEDAWSAFPKLQAYPDVRSRVHGWDRSRPLRTLGTAFVRTVVTMITRPGPFFGFLGRNLLRPLRGLPARMVFATPFLRLRPDVVHFEFGGAARFRLSLLEDLRAPVAVSFRGWDICGEGLGDPDYYRGVWARARRIHFVSRGNQERAEERGYNGNPPSEIIHPAVDAGLFPGHRRNPDPAGSDGRPLRVVSVGRLEPKKGYVHALDAIRRLVDDGLHVSYEVIGEGSQRAALEGMIMERNLESHVVLRGARTRLQVVECLREADVLLHSAVSEGFCNAALEAQAVQLPVVCSDAEGLSENIEDGVTGVLTQRGDDAGMAAALTALARDGERRVAMGVAGRKRVLDRFRPEDQLDRFEAFYRAVLG